MYRGFKLRHCSLKKAIKFGQSKSYQGWSVSGTCTQEITLHYTFPILSVLDNKDVTIAVNSIRLMCSGVRIAIVVVK